MQIPCTIVTGRHNAMLHKSVQRRCKAVLCILIFDVRDWKMLRWCLVGSAYHSPRQTRARYGRGERAWDTHSGGRSRPAVGRGQVSTDRERLGHTGRAANRRRSLQPEEMDALQPFSLGFKTESQRIPDWPRHSGASLKKTGFALRTCCKRFTGPCHPERNQQFGLVGGASIED